MYVQYFKYLWGLMTFDLGYSLSQFPQTVTAAIARGIPWTLGLLSIATILSFILGNTVGALLGWRKSPKALKTVLPFTLTFTSIPAFMLGILFIYVFGFGLRWFPFSRGHGSGLPGRTNRELPVPRKRGYNLVGYRSGMPRHGRQPGRSAVSR